MSDDPRTSWALPASALADIMGMADTERYRSGPIVPMACPPWLRHERLRAAGETLLRRVRSLRRSAGA